MKKLVLLLLLISSCCYAQKSVTFAPADIAYEANSDTWNYKDGVLVKAARKFDANKGELSSDASLCIVSSKGNISRIEISGSKLSNMVSGAGKCTCSSSKIVIEDVNAPDVVCRSNGSSAVIGRVTVVIDDDNRMAPELSFAAKTYASYVGEESYGQSVKNEHQLVVSYATSDEKYVSVEPVTGYIHTATDDNTIILCSTMGDDTYASGAACYVVRPSVVTNELYREVTENAQLKNGTRIMVVCDHVALAIGSASGYGSAEATISADGGLYPKLGTDIFTLYGDNEHGWALKGANGFMIATGKGISFVPELLGNDDELFDVRVKADGIGVIQSKVSFDGKRPWLYYDRGKFVLGHDKNGNIHLYYRDVYDGVKIKMSTIGYSTLYYSDRNLVVPEGIVATTYCVKDENLSVSHTYHTGEVIPRGEAVVLQGSAGDYDFLYSDESGFDDPENQLRGSDDVSTVKGAEAYYILSISKDNPQPNTIGFYRVSSDGFCNGAHKAYLAIPTSAGFSKSSFVFDDIVVNGISQVEFPYEHQRMYNLQGQQVGKDYRGIVIISGHKFLMR
jgi:hypothetical protein